MLISSSICFKSFKYDFRLKTINDKMINNIYFPSLDTYNDIINKDINTYIIKYKNSEIIMNQNPEQIARDW